MKEGKIQTLVWSKLLALINTCYAYVKLHSEEGYGRILAEAMLLGNSVVATRYSGNEDFVIHIGIPVNPKIRNIDLDEHQWGSISDKATWGDVEKDAANTTEKY